MGNTTMTLSSPWRFSHTSAGCRATSYNSRRTGNVPNGSKLLPGTNIRCMKHGPNRVSVPIVSRIFHEGSFCVPLRLCRKLAAGEHATLVCSRSASLDKEDSVSTHRLYPAIFGAAAHQLIPPDDSRRADSVRRPCARPATPRRTGLDPDERFADLAGTFTDSPGVSAMAREALGFVAHRPRRR